MQFKKRTSKKIIAIALATFVLSSSAFMYTANVKADEQVEEITSQQTAEDSQTTNDGAEAVTSDTDSQASNTPEESQLEVTPNENPLKAANNGSNGFIKENGKWYFYVNNVQKKGWIEYKGNKYYIINTYELPQNMWRKINGNLYYFNKDGIMIKDQKISIDGKEYQFNKNGHMVDLDSSKKLNEVSAEQQKLYDLGQQTLVEAASKKKNGVLYEAGKYYRYQDGKKVRGWYKENGKWYYFLNSFNRAENLWRKIDNNLYYFDQNGVMLTNTTTNIKGITYKFNKGGSLASSSSQIKINKVIEVAKSKIGSNYVWGAQGPNTFDCSGLMLYSFSHGAGITLPRVSKDQATVGTYVSRSELRPGDLIFWGSPVHHVALYIGNGKYIHAPQPGSTVTIANLGGYTTARRVIQ
ncbi:NlpC/P60 family protein [Peptostreptococcus stomatis DSM 17678]|uniref:NlpC/P60 family protein n=1 Tax=Peptostreptococcus stomatis DSM 17678 TaxID=596315 RepID=E0E2Q2_9FIRM|nr:NlpC/P60 family protein [Peptostreptococcus stomatis]EFM64833.1 NlpC/P60 family protein [Peptostreptococcus stomatis DSM 17678]MBL6465607.1 C40 family peptidase [Peptostreptococcus stomatis]